MGRWGRAAAAMYWALLLATPASAAFECTPQTSARLCLTMDVRAALEKSTSPILKSTALTSIANMQAADGRLDLAQETLRLAHESLAEALPADGEWLRRVVEKQAALGDEAGAEAGATVLAEPGERARYLIAIVAGLPKSTDAATVERLVKAVRFAADAVTEPNQRHVSRGLLYFMLGSALASAGWIDLALALNNAEPPFERPIVDTRTLVMARLEHGSAAEAENLLTRLSPQDAGLWIAIAEDLVKKHQYSAALDFMARQSVAADMFVLAQAKLGAGDIDGAIDIASRSSADAATDDSSSDGNRWTQVWRDITIALAAEGRIEKAMVTLTRATPDWPTSTNAAIARALARVGRRDEAMQFARVAFNGFANAGEFGDRDMPTVADAFLSADDVSGAITVSSPDCYPELPLTMAERALQRNDRTRARAILARLEGPLMACIQKYPKVMADTEQTSIAERFLCSFAQLHPRRDSLAKFAGIDAGFRRARGKDEESWKLWDETIRPRIYGCIAVAIAQTENMRAAQSFAESAPTPAASYEALLTLARFAMQEEPVAASDLIRAVAHTDSLPPSQLTGLSDLHWTLKCLYGDRRDLVPIEYASYCRH